MQYKIKEGVKLPELFKMKVDLNKSEIVKEYLISIGYKLSSLRYNKYIFGLPDKVVLISTDKKWFKNHISPKIKFKDYFEPISSDINFTDNDYKPLPEKLTVSKSSIHGLGIFAKENIYLLSGRECSEYVTHVDVYHKNGKTKLLRTPLGGFINHSFTPNCKLDKYIDGFYHYFLKPTRDILAGEELTIDYTKEFCGKEYNIGCSSKTECCNKSTYEESVKEEPKCDDHASKFIKDADNVFKDVTDKIYYQVFGRLKRPYAPIESLISFIENIPPIYRLKNRLLVIDTDGKYMNEIESYITKNILSSNPYILEQTMPKFSGIKYISVIISGINVTVVDATDSPLFIGSNLLQWQ